MNVILRENPVSVEGNADEAAKLLKAMGNKHRLLILCRLADREHGVGELEEIVGLSQSALSQPLARLRRDQIVTTRRSAQSIYYSIADNKVEQLIHGLARLFQEHAAENLHLSEPLSSIDTIR